MIVATMKTPAYIIQGYDSLSDCMMAVRAVPKGQCDFLSRLWTTADEIRTGMSEYPGFSTAGRLSIIAATERRPGTAT